MIYYAFLLQTLGGFVFAAWLLYEEGVGKNNGGFLVNWLAILFCILIWPVVALRIALIFIVTRTGQWNSELMAGHFWR